MLKRILFSTKKNKRIRFHFSSARRQKASRNRIPWDLWPQILSFLPARSLFVFRSVCKSFLSIIDDPEFIFSNNALETRFLTYKIDSNKEVIFEVRETNNRVIEPEPELLPTTITDRNFDRFWNLLCSFKGLVLLSYKVSQTDVVAMWNPSIKKHRQLSLPTELLYLEFGLGYDPSTNDYKLVAFDYRADDAWVYSVKMDTWTKVLHSRFGDEPSHVGEDDEGTYFYKKRGLSFKNKVFWIEYRHPLRLGYNDRLLGFDFETEEFRYDEMPYSVDETNDDAELMMLDGGSSVGVWWADQENRVFVWALETDAMSWTLRYKLAPPQGLDWRLREMNGELVGKYWDFRGDLRIVSYEIDIETQMYRTKFQRSIRNCFDAYVESLVML